MAASSPVAPRFVYPAWAFGHRGRVVRDGVAAGGRAIEVSGAGARRKLLWGQDGSLCGEGEYVAIFGLRAIEGSGDVRLTIARSGARPLVTRTVRLEELSISRYDRVRVPFWSGAGWPLEYRLSAERARLRMDHVVVEGGGAAGQNARPAGSRLPVRKRRVLPLTEVWGKAPARAAAQRDVTVVRLRRRLAEDGWYRFCALWRQGTGEHIHAVAVDLWAACRDEWGIVRTLDYGAAYDTVPRGLHETSAWMGPAAVRRYGPPVALFVQVYRRGLPVAAAWRKWGIPVDDKYIVEAQRAGELREALPTE
jgi:hypothetical protein